MLSSQLRGFVRPLHTRAAVLNKLASSIFGNLTKPAKATELEQLAKMADVMSEGSEALEQTRDRLTPENDTALQKYYRNTMPPVVAISKYLSPVQRQVYKANVAKNGFFKSGDKVSVNGTSYTMTLTKDEIEALEPSIYLQLYRIKSSVKKTMLVTRMLLGLPLKEAIKQCHFSLRKVAGDIGELLEQGLKRAPEVRLNPDELYVSQIWVGSDGQWTKQPEFKGRGRVGVITHRYVHVKVVLKGPQTKKRLELKAKKAATWEQLPSEKIRGVSNAFKW